MKHSPKTTYSLTHSAWQSVSTSGTLASMVSETGREREKGKKRGGERDPNILYPAVTQKFMELVVASHGAEGKHPLRDTPGSG